MICVINTNHISISGDDSCNNNSYNQDEFEYCLLYSGKRPIKIKTEPIILKESSDIIQKIKDKNNET